MDREYVGHESYGMVNVSRRSGGDSVLFGSSIPVNNKIGITISHAEYSRGLNHDWYHSTGEIIEIELSPVQFAEAISTGMNTSGVPCTIRYINGNYTKPCEFENKRTIFEDEFANSMKEVGRKLSEDMTKIKEILSEKKAPTKTEKDTIISLLNKLSMELNSNIPYMSNCFNEQMDRTVSECKGEVDAFIQNKIISYGLQGLKDEMLKLGEIQGIDD